MTTTTRRLNALAAACVVAATVAGCGGGTGGDQPRSISKADMGKKWPLTVSDGVLS